MRNANSARLHEARGAVRIEAVEVGEPGRGEALVRMEACGVCHSDLFVGSLEKLPVMPLTLGHEGIGRIEAVGPDATGWAVGDRVGMTFLGTTCGTCEQCQAGRDRYCAKQTNFGYTLQGVLAGYVVAPTAALVRVPAEIDATALAPMCCAGWTAFGAVNEAGLVAGQTVALFGFGGLGHLALQIAKQQGLRVAVVDTSEAKLDMARAGGAELTASGDSAGRTVLKQWGGVDAAIVLTGSAAAIPQAFKALKRLGRLVLVGMSVSQYELPLLETVLKGIQIRGSYLGTRQDLESVFALARSGAIEAHVETHGIAETPAILERMKRGEIAGRAVVAF